MIIPAALFQFRSVILFLKKLISRSLTLSMLILIFGLLLVFHSIADVWGQTGWIPASETLYERRIGFLEIHPDESSFFAGVPGGVYVSRDGGKTWKAVLELQGESSQVNIICIDKLNPERIWVGSDEGVYLSQNGGRNWKRIFYRPDEAEEKVLALAQGRENPRLILVGTASGLFLTHDGGSQWLRVPAFQDIAIYQIESMGSDPEIFLVATAQGLYVSTPDLSGWEQTYYAYSIAAEKGNGADSAEGASSSNEQFELEDVSLEDNPQGRIAFVADSNGARPRITVFEETAVSFSDGFGEIWQNRTVHAFPRSVSQRPAVLSHNAHKMFVPTFSGVFLYDQESGMVVDISWGLPSKKITSLVYDPRGDVLFAATDRGVFKLPHPEINLFLDERSSEQERGFDHLMSYFDHEPTIQELQEVAMRYAEVHPEKIAQWRRAAGSAAWLPEVGLGYDKGSDEVVEVDRGGTNDPDTFIIGPEESDLAWSFDISWDLSEIMWNPDQTSIDNRSKLMVQLRDDLLNELTHLYFARRRLQVESLMRPSQDITQVADTDLKIQEYTAGIDALTGGYLTRKLGTSVRVSVPWDWEKDLAVQSEPSPPRDDDSVEKTIHPVAEETFTPPRKKVQILGHNT